MKNNYLIPNMKSLLNHFSLCTVTQYTINYSQCPAADPSVNDQIIKIIDSHTEEAEFCDSSAPIVGSLLSTAKCAETGSTIYTVIVSSVTNGSQFVCGGGNDFNITAEIDPGFPQTCTVTSVIVGDIEVCS